VAHRDAPRILILKISDPYMQYQKMFRK